MTREDYLKNLIVKRFGSIRKFSEHIGVPSSTITSMLSRGVGGTSVDTVIRVCKELGITVEELQSIEVKGTVAKGTKTPTTIAAHLPDNIELTEEDMKQINDFIQFVISKKKKEQK